MQFYVQINQVIRFKSGYDEMGADSSPTFVPAIHPHALTDVRPVGGIPVMGFDEELRAFPLNGLYTIVSSTKIFHL